MKIKPVLESHILDSDFDLLLDPMDKRDVPGIGGRRGGEWSFGMM